MEVTQVKITRAYEMFGHVYWEGTKFYITDTYTNDKYDFTVSGIFNDDGEELGVIEGSWQDHANGDLFVNVNEDESEEYVARCDRCDRTSLIWKDGDSCDVELFGKKCDGIFRKVKNNKD